MNKKYNLDHVKLLCQKNGIEVMDSEYKEIKSPLTLKCKKGHIFTRSLDKLKKSQNCVECNKLKINSKIHKEEQIKKNCNKKGYNFISIENEKVSVVCKVGHYVIKSANSINNKKYQCKKCAAIKTSKRCKLSYNYVKVYIEKNNEQLISSEYINTNQLLKVKCKNNHEYDIRFSNYTKGHRCPFCRNKKEEYCRELFEKLTNKKFKKSRPDFLKYKNGRNLELDGFCPELNLAFEYDGEQHFKPFSNWGGEKRYLLSKERDLFKDQKCIENNIKLIRVPYFIKNKEQYIKQILIDLKIVLTN